jgi:hypothetical protein
MRTFDGLPHLADWMERVRALGHGQRSEVTAAEALKIAWGTEPQAIIGSDHELIGKKVTAAADDYGRDPVAGTLVDVTEFQISIQPDSDDPGQLVVHFPQIGFVLQPT